MTIAALMLSGLSSYDRARVACETWASDFDVLEVHSFTPAPNLPLRLVGTREGPRSCFEKRLMGLDGAQLDLSTDWYLCCSDDNYFWRPQLEMALKMVDDFLSAKIILSDLACVSFSMPYGKVLCAESPMLVGGHAGELRIADGQTVRYPSGGAGYCLNRAALEILVANLETIRPHWAISSNNDDCEDVFMGWAARRLEIPFLETPGFYGCNPMVGNCHPLPGPEAPPVSFHYVTPEQMRMLRSQQAA